jgi:hypothetical protein
MASCVLAVPPTATPPKSTDAGAGDARARCRAEARPPRDARSGTAQHERQAGRDRDEDADDRHIGALAGQRRVEDQHRRQQHHRQPVPAPPSATARAACARRTRRSAHRSPRRRRSADERDRAGAERADRGREQDRGGRDGGADAGPAHHRVGEALPAGLRRAVRRGAREPAAPHGEQRRADDQRGPRACGEGAWRTWLRARAAAHARRRRLGGGICGSGRTPGGAAGASPTEDPRRPSGARWTGTIRSETMRSAPMCLPRTSGGQPPLQRRSDRA